MVIINNIYPNKYLSFELRFIVAYIHTPRFLTLSTILISRFYESVATWGYGSNFLVQNIINTTLSWKCFVPFLRIVHIYISIYLACFLTYNSITAVMYNSEFVYYYWRLALSVVPNDESVIKIYYSLIISRTLETHDEYYYRGTFRVNSVVVVGIFMKSFLIIGIS